jgi:hypothetical protein
MILGLMEIKYTDKSKLGGILLKIKNQSSSGVPNFYQSLLHKKLASGLGLSLHILNSNF